MRCLQLALIVVAALGGTYACTGSGTGRSPSPVRLTIPRNALPGPGLCRIWVSGLAASQQPLPRGCDGIEHVAPLGSRVLHRPDDGSRTVQVRYMSTGVRGEVIGIDLFDIDNGRLLRVIQRYGEPSPFDTGRAIMPIPGA